MFLSYRIYLSCYLGTQAMFIQWVAAYTLNFKTCSQDYLGFSWSLTLNPVTFLILHTDLWTITVDFLDTIFWLLKLDLGFLVRYIFYWLPWDANSAKTLIKNISHYIDMQKSLYVKILKFNHDIEYDKHIFVCIILHAYIMKSTNIIKFERVKKVHKSVMTIYVVTIWEGSLK